MRGVRPSAAPGRGTAGGTGCRGSHGAVEYAYSGVPGATRRTIGTMLWSDPENKTPKFLRETQEMLRRSGVLLALAMVVLMLVAGAR